MALQLTAPIEKTEELEETNKLYPPSEGEEPTRVTIKQASQAENERRQDQFSDIHTELSYDTSGRQVVVSREKHNVEAMKRLDAFLTLVDTNIVVIEKGKKKPEPLFKFEDGELKMTEAEFKEAWGKLPVSVTDEIHSKIVKVNPDWSRRGNLL